MVDEEEVLEIPLEYVETPRGKVASLETVKQIANALMMIQEDEEALREELRLLSTKTPSDEKMKTIEDRLASIERMLEEVTDKQSLIVEVLQELAQGLEKMRKSD